MKHLAATLALIAATRPQERAGEIWARIGPHFAPPAEFRDDFGKLKPVLQWDDGRPVRTPAEWAERRAGIQKRWHELLGPWPELLEKPMWTALSSESVEGFTRKRIRIQVAPDRISDSAYLLLPEGRGPVPAVIDVFYYPEDGAGLRPEKRKQNDFGYQMALRGFAALSIGQNPTAPKEGADLYYPTWDKAQLQPLSYLAYVAANGHTLLSRLPEVDPRRIGIVGHSYGGKWALFAGALYDRFAAVCVSDPGIVFDEARPNVNYWEPWYLGYVPGKEFRPRGVLTGEHPRVGPYKTMVEEGRDLHELLALVAPRPLFVAGGSEDRLERWKALNHAAAVARLLGFENRVGMSSRPGHKITPQASDAIGLFFEYFLRSQR